MIEKAIEVVLETGRARAPLVKRCFARLPAGGWVAAVVVLVVGGRGLWVAGLREPRREKIAAAFGSTCLFDGCPQPDAAGSRVCYVRRGLHGREENLLDVRTGEKQKFRGGEEPGWGANVWPWAPDGEKFIYGVREELFVWRGPTAGSARGGLKLGAQVTELVWLDSEHFVCLLRSNHLCHVRERQGKLELLADYPLPGGGKIASLNAVGTNAVAWLRDDRIWRLDLGTNAPGAGPATAGGAVATGSGVPGRATVWLNPERKGLGTMSYSPGSGEVLVTWTTKDIDWELWKWRPADGPEALTLVLKAPIIYFVHCLPKDQYAFVTRKYGDYCVAIGSFKEPDIRIVPVVTQSQFSFTPDGAHLVITGMASNDITAGIWECDTDTGKLTALVSGSERPSPAAARAVMAESRSGPPGAKARFIVVQPAGFDRNAHRKYPVIIGNTSVGCPPWVHAVANCGFFVIIVHRNNWMEDIETWGDRIMALYPTLAKIPELDLDQAYLFGGSAETRYLSKLATERPELWKGLLLLSPGALPDLAAFPLSKPVPKMMISYGDQEHREQQIQRYLEDAARRGISVQAILHKGQGHILAQVGEAELDRAQAIIRFVSDDPKL